MQNIISWVAIVFASLCFLLYFVLTVAPLFLARRQHEADKAAARRENLAPPVPIDFPGLVKAFATLVDSLVKAGPALWALIGSMIFLLIAGFASGLFTIGGP